MEAEAAQGKGGEKRPASGCRKSSSLASTDGEGSQQLSYRVETRKRGKAAAPAGNDFAVIKTGNVDIVVKRALRKHEKSDLAPYDSLNNSNG